MEEKALSILKDVTERVRYYAKRNMADWLELGKALTEAKELVPHGEWEEYVSQNAGMSQRMCQNCMKAYSRFGTDNPEISGLNMTQVIGLLSASDEEIEKLSGDGDLSAMSSREIKARLQKEREKGRKEGREEAEEEQAEKTRDAMQCMANDKARELARQKEAFDKTLKEKVAEAKAAAGDELEVLKEQLAEKRAEAEELRFRAEQAEASAEAVMKAGIEKSRDVSAQANELEGEKRKLHQEIESLESTIREMQADYDALNQEHLDTLSKIAKGDAERTSADILSAEAVGDAVRMFIGQVGRVPYMHTAFATMDSMEREEYLANVMQVKEWADKSLKALDSVNGIGGVVE